MDTADTLGWKAPCRLELKPPVGPDRSDANGLHPGNKFGRYKPVSKGDLGTLSNRCGGGVGTREDCPSPL